MMQQIKVGKVLGMARDTLAMLIEDDGRLVDSPFEDSLSLFLDLHRLFDLMVRGAKIVEALDEKGECYESAFLDLMGKPVNDALRSLSEIWMVMVAGAMADGCSCGFAQAITERISLARGGEGAGKITIEIPWERDARGEAAFGIPGQPSVSVSGDVDPIVAGRIVDEVAGASLLVGVDGGSIKPSVWAEPSEDRGEWVVAWTCAKCGRHVPRIFFQEEPARRYAEKKEEEPDEERICSSCWAAVKIKAGAKLH